MQDWETFSQLQQRKIRLPPSPRLLTSLEDLPPCRSCSLEPMDQLEMLPTLALAHRVLGELAVGLNNGRDMKMWIPSKYGLALNPELG